MSGSLSFERAAGYYDATRTTDPATLRQILELLSTHVAGEGDVLEIGVGTGQLALPLAAAGVRVVGVDLSAAMMARLVEKADGRRSVALVQGDATRLPFADGVFGGAYARWVLHLIPEWERVLRELDRVVGAGARVAIEPGGFAGPFREVFLRFVEILGDAARPPGLDPVDRDRQLDAGMARTGWSLDHVQEITYAHEVPLGRFFEDVRERRHSWTWGVPSDALEAATTEVRAWAAGRFDLDAPLPDEPTRWRVYRRERAFGPASGDELTRYPFPNPRTGGVRDA
jgi:ubiquinone/menaquinone biosynthesis C-methylase UbiE